MLKFQPTSLHKNFVGLMSVSNVLASSPKNDALLDTDNDEDKTSQDVAKQYLPMTQ